MGYSMFLVSSVAILASFMITGNKAESHHELCLGKPVNFTEIEYIALGECIAKYAPPPTLKDGVTESPESIKERIKKAKAHKCMEPCFMEHKKMFVDGKIDLPACEKFIEEFPKDVRAKLKESLHKCAEPIKDKQLKNDDKECPDYAAFMKCVDDDENKICERKE